MTVRERLDALTAKLWTSIDAALDESTPPDANSIAASQTAIDTAATELAAITGASTVADLNAQITAITAIAAGQRTQAQKDMLVLLRIVKAQDAQIIALYRATLDNRRRVKTLQRAFTVAARFAMFLDGGPSRVRVGDVDGEE